MKRRNGGIARGDGETSVVLLGKSVDTRPKIAGPFDLGEHRLAAFVVGDPVIRRAERIIGAANIRGTVRVKEGRHSEQGALTDDEFSSAKAKLLG